MTAPAASHEETFPWERRDQLGLARAFADNLAMSIRAPRRFYGLAARDASSAPAVAYGFAFELVVALASFAYAETLGEAELHGAVAPLAPQIDQVIPGAAARLETLAGASAWASLLASPVTYVLELYTMAAITWVGLRLARGLRTSFGHIVRLLAYAGWLRLFGLLGMAGDLLLSSLGGLLSLAVGSYVWVALVRASQGIDTQRAVVASIYGTLIALAVGCVCVVPPAVALAVWLLAKLAAM